MAADTVVAPAIAHFFVFNSLFGPTEETEQQKLLFYHPADRTVDRQLMQVGLVEGLLKFPATFHPSRPCEFMRTSKTHYAFMQPEQNYWMVLAVSVPTLHRSTGVVEHRHEDLPDCVLASTLLSCYRSFRLWYGPFSEIVSKASADALRREFAHFYPPLLAATTFDQPSFLSILNGMQFLAVERNVYLQTLSTLNLLEQTFACVRATLLLHGDALVYCGLDEQNARILYPHLTATHHYGPKPLQSTNSPPTQSGGFFVTGPEDVYGAPGGVDVVPIYLEDSPWMQWGRMGEGDGDTDDELEGEGVLNDGVENVLEGGSEGVEGERRMRKYYLIVYQHQHLRLALIVDGTRVGSLELYVELQHFFEPRIPPLAAALADQATRRTIQDSSSRFIYFNRSNLALLSTHTMRTPQALAPATDATLLDMHTDLGRGCGHMREMAVCTGEGWVVGRRCDQRDLYVLPMRRMGKDGTLVQISDEIDRLSKAFFSDLFS
eukprot:comp21498_c0_seq1/m.29806 comp21498_c0_seq1/g.29806  ORF comp21498_c0_seq1/g.29806 comp21498_c0_seq1/m.29806 type:complete len:491 (-) comp21498_c0_seq1:286-1758(-)